MPSGKQPGPGKVTSTAVLLCLALLLGIAGCVTRPEPGPSWSIDAHYPGGNIVIENLSSSSAVLTPDQSHVQQGQWWFYWNFRLRSRYPENVTIHFREHNPIGVRGPAVSYDSGRTWEWLGNQSSSGSIDLEPSRASFVATVSEGTPEVRYAFCPTYLETHLQEWRARHAHNPNLTISTLCRSRQGRRVELIQAGCLDPERVRGVVLLTSRHHSCEAMATYVLEGVLEAILSDDALGNTWRDNWQIMAIPFVDKDGVEDGDQGKFRAPHDHNRDYNHELYPEITAIKNLGQHVSSNVVAMLDLHCPWIRGKWNDRVYLVGSAVPQRWQQQLAFAQLLEQNREGTLPFRAADCLPFGMDWNTGQNSAAGETSTRWANDAFPHAQVVTSVEIPYADALGVEVNAHSARSLGRDIAAALAEYLK